MKRCVAYCRVSTNDTDQKNSIQNQMRHYQDMFEREGYEVADCGLLYKKNGDRQFLKGIFADEGLTGTSYRKRMAFQEMLEAAKRGEFDTIFVKDVSRFVRSVEDGSAILKDLKVIGVEVIFETGNLRSLSGQHEVMLNIMMSISQEESRHKSDAVKFGIRMFQNKGGWKSKAPYGYDKDPQIKGGLIINEREAGVVRRIFDLYNQGFGYRHISTILNEENIFTKTGVRWSQKQIMSMLKYKIYIGVMELHKEEVADVNRKTRRQIDEKNWTIINNHTLRIIADEVFHQAGRENQKRAKFTVEKSRYSAINLFSNMVFCEHCGGAFKRKKYRPYPGDRGKEKEVRYELVCQNNDTFGSSKCPYRSATFETDLIESVKAAVLRLQMSEILLDQMFTLYLELNFSYDVSGDRVSVLNEQIKKQDSNLQYVIQQMTEYLENGQQDRANALKVAQDSYIDQKIILQDELDRIYNKQKVIRETKERFAEYKKRLIEIDPDNLSNSDLRTVFKNITVSPLEYTDELRQRMKEFKIGKKNLYYRLVHYNYWFLDTDLESFQLDCIREIDANKANSSETSTKQVPVFQEIKYLFKDKNVVIDTKLASLKSKGTILTRNSIKRAPNRLRGKTPVLNKILVPVQLYDRIGYDFDIVTVLYDVVGPQF